MAKRGRPPSFDRDEALQAAVEVFAEKGYDGTTLDDLLAAMGGINPPSFYNTFRSKDALFEEALELYVRETSTPGLKALAEATSARDAIAGLLRESVKSYTRPGHAPGCLIIDGAMRTTTLGKHAEQLCASLRQGTPQVIRERLLRAQAEGELRKGAPIEALTTFYVVLAQGLAVRARDGVSRRNLLSAVDAAMRAWDTMILPVP